MSYSESIIIPLSLFKQCHFEELVTTKNEGKQFMHDPLIPDIEKLRRANHEETLKKHSRLELRSDTTATWMDKRVLLDNVQSKYRPQANAILDFILDHPAEINWIPDTNELMLKGRIKNNANIRDILLALMNAIVITKHTDVPPGTYEFYDVLVNTLKMPKSWIPAKFVTRSSKRVALQQKDGGKQYGSGINNWIVY